MRDIPLTASNALPVRLIGSTCATSVAIHNNANRDLDILMQSGDSIYFPTIDDGVLPKVHVFGEVQTQGTFAIPSEGMTLLEALGQAEGAFTDTADINDVYLMRTEAGRESAVTYKLSFAELYQGPSIPLANEDRIYVAPRSLSRWDVWWRLAIPITISARAIGAD